MRILNFNDSDMLAGGAETYLRNTADLLEQAGHQVFSFLLSSTTHGGEGRTFRFKAVDPTVFSYYHRHNFFYPALYRALRSYIDLVKPDCIHLHNNNRYPATVLTACGAIPTVRTMHDFAPVCPTAWCVRQQDLSPCQGGAGLRCVTSRCIPFNTYLFDYCLAPNRNQREQRTVKALFAPSRALADTLACHGYKRIVHLPYFTLAPPLDGDGGSESPDAIVYLGGLYRHKGVAYLLQAFQLLMAEKQQVRLIIIGDGPERDSLQTMATDLGLEQIVFTGVLDHARMETVLRQALCTVVPSIWQENAPLVCIESMARSVPVVAFAGGGMGELINSGQNGILVERLDIHALAAALRSLLDHPDRQLRMGRAARTTFETNHTGEPHLARLTALYQEAIGA